MSSKGVPEIVPKRPLAVWGIMRGGDRKISGRECQAVAKYIGELERYAKRRSLNTQHPTPNTSQGAKR